MGACFEVYKRLGCGFLEPVYQECLEMEFSWQGIPHEAQKPVSLAYRNQALEQTFRLDFLCYDRIVVEIKAVEALVDGHRAQVLNYLAAGRFPLGILVNFGHHPGVEWERVVLTRKPSADSRKGFR